MRRTLLDIIARSPLRNARAGIQVVSLDDGAVVFAQSPDELLNPASNVKLVTAAVALSRLGLEYRFETEFLTESEWKSGKLKTLWVRGKGDPTITTERLYQMVSELKHAGLEEVTGDLVLDDGYFDADRAPPGWDQESSDRAYMAPTGALSLNWNTVGVYLRPGAAPGAPGAVELEPPSEFFTVESELLTGNRNARRFNVASVPERDGAHQKITVRGSVPHDRGVFTVWKKIDSPPFYFGQTLKALLLERGIKVKGKVKQGTVPTTGVRPLYVAQSETLDVVLKKLNKNSSNFIAEQLIKTLGAEGKGVPGSTARGIEVVEDYLEREVLLPRGSYVMKNGSGLNDTNRFSAVQLNRVLKHMYEKFPLEPEFLSSLGVAARDGTLRYRFEGTEAAGRLRAKTGTLENVSALSGYVQAVGGERFIFSVLINDFPGRAGTVVQHIDALGAAVAATGSSTGLSTALASVMPPPQVGPIEQVKERMRTFLAVGQKGDKRNVPFLRTAWRAERDPALRAVVADALFQSDPQDAGAARTLLDSFSAGTDVYGRLKQVSTELGVPVPGVSSVVELAASGNLDALARLIELSRAAHADGAAEGELARAFSDVARSSPDELLLSLRVAAEPDREAALTLLARGLVAAADADHPFWPALRKAMGSLDAERASFAKTAETALSQRIAKEKAPPPVDDTAMLRKNPAATTSPVSAPGG